MIPLADESPAARATRLRQQSRKMYRARRRQEDTTLLFGCGFVAGYIALGLAVILVLIWAVIRLTLHYT